MTQILTNRRRRMLVFVLLHEEFCKKLEGCICTKSRRPERLVPSALTLPALATIEAPDAVLSVKEVECAIRRGDVTARSKPEAEQPVPVEPGPAKPDESVAVAPASATEADTPQRQQKKRARE